MSSKDKVPIGEELAFIPSIINLIGILIFFYGILLLCTQVYLYLDSGVWVRLPASYMVSNPNLLVARELQDGVDQSSSQLELAMLLKELTIRRTIDPYLPLINSRDDSWFVTPHSWIGLSGLIMGILRFISIPGLSFFLGFGIFIWGLTLNGRFTRTRT